MTLLLAFAFLAGAGTAVSPCVLPVLPALLSAGATGGRRRPVGIVLGLATTFTVTIVGLSAVVDGVGLGDGLTRGLAIAALLCFGLAVAVPAVGDRLEAPLSRLAALGPRTGGDGFVSGLGVGAALGFVYAPCAGPILAAVIAVSAASGRTVALGAAYALGSALVLLALVLFGRRLIGPARGPVVQRVLGGVMVLTAVAMAFSLDVRFQTAIAQHLPAALVDPTRSLEGSAAVKQRLADLQGRPRFVASTRPRPPAPHRAARAAAPAVPALDRLGPAPDFTGNEHWFNTPGDRPLTLAGLRGRVVLVDFWTYTCINCIRTFPYLKAWDARYRRDGLTIVGVHTPEFAFERDAGNVADAIKQNGLRYPVAQDNQRATWDAWGNQYWPASYLIDATGQVRYVHFGEGGDGQTEDAIRSLLAQAHAVRGGGSGGTPLGTARSQPGPTLTPAAQATPETYLGTARAQGFTPPARPGRHLYPPPTRAPALNHFALTGTWDVDEEAATAGPGAGLDATVQAKDVYLVLSSPLQAARRVRVSLDGQQLAPVVVTRQRLYQLVHLPDAGRHHLHLDLDEGLSAYAFTFG